MAQVAAQLLDQPWLTFRGGINAYLAALVSNNSGGSGPPSPNYEGHFWYDTSVDVLYQRNAAGSAYIRIASFNQTDDIGAAVWGNWIETLLWDFSIDGSIASVESSALAAGFGYRWRFEGVSADVASAARLYSEIYGSIDGYDSTRAFTGNFVMNTGYWYGHFHIDLPLVGGKRLFSTYGEGGTLSGKVGTDRSSNSAAGQFNAGGVVNLASGNQTIDKVRFSTNVGNLAAGRIVEEKRRIY